MSVSPPVVGLLGHLDLDLAISPRQSRAGRTGRREESDVVGGEGSARPATDRMTVPDLAGGTGRRRLAWLIPGAGIRNRAPRVKPPGRQLEGLVQEAHRLLDPLGAHHAGEPDRRGGDHLDVDLRGGEDLEHGGRHAGMTAHPRPDERNLGDAIVGEDLARADLGRPGPYLEADGEVGLGHGEGDVGGPVQRHVLHDGVHVDDAVGQRPEQSGRDAGLVGDTGDGHLGLGRVVGDGGDDGLLHGRILLDHPGAGLPGETRTDVQRHAVVAGELDRAQGEHTPPAGRDVEHLLEAHPTETARLGDDARIGAEHPGHVGVELARVGAEGRGQRHGGGVRTAPAQRGHVAVERHALEARHHRYAALGQRGAQPVRLDLDDLGLVMCFVGVDARLAPGEGRGASTPRNPAERHAQQRHGHNKHSWEHVEGSPDS